MSGWAIVDRSRKKPTERSTPFKTGGGGLKFLHIPPLTSPAASKVLQSHYAELVSAISAAGPLSLALKLYSKGLIERKTKDDVSLSVYTRVYKACIIVDAMKRKVKADPSLFFQFTTILQDEGDNALKLLGKKLSAAFIDKLNVRVEHFTWITNLSQSREIFNSAMKYGHVVVRQRKVLLVGVNGTGKSSLLCLLLKEEPPPVRQSTSCAERPVRAVRLDSTSSELVRMGSRKLMAALAKAMSAHNSSKQEEQGSTVDTSPKTQASSQHSHGSSDKPTLERELTPTSEKSQEVDLSFNSRVSSENPTLEKELVTLLKGGVITDEKLQEVDWTYIIDTGGQPQFMEVLPTLLKGTCLTICVFKLSEKFSAYPMIEYYDNGQLICEHVQCDQTNEHFLKHLTSSMKSFRPEGGPSIIFVGTHRDQEHECTETREEKEQRISKLAPQESVIVAKKTFPQKFIFPINARNPEPEDKKAAENIRKILLCSTLAQTDKLPLQWYGLELKLEERAEVLGRHVLTYDECYSAAQELHFANENSFRAALHHLSDLSILSYYPDILPNVVFCNPQVLLDKITELAKLNLLYRSNSSKQPVTDDQSLPLQTASEIFMFRDWGKVTVELLEDDCLKKHYHHDVFSPLDLVKLFKDLLIFADFRDGTFFMPCLLPWLNERELTEHRVNTEGRGSESALSSLILKLPDGPRNGLFCSLISSLISKRDASSVPPILEVAVNPTSNVPMCLKRNCVQLAVQGYPGYITLIDSIDYLEVHVTSCLNSSSLAKVVCDTLRLGLTEAASRVGCSKLTFEKSFFCPCKVGGLHLVNFGEENYCICPNDRNKYHELEENQKIWLADGKELILDLPCQTTRAWEPKGTKDDGEEEDFPHSPCLKRTMDNENLEDKVPESDLVYLSDLQVADVWRRLGLHLGVPDYRLDVIQENNAGRKDPSSNCLGSMFSWWLKNSNMCTSKQLVTALSAVGKRAVAKSVAQKYGVRDLPDGELAEQDPQRVPTVGGTEEKQENKRSSPNIRRKSKKYYHHKKKKHRRHRHHCKQSSESPSPDRSGCHKQEKKQSPPKRKRKRRSSHLVSPDNTYHQVKERRRHSSPWHRSPYPFQRQRWQRRSPPTQRHFSRSPSPPPSNQYRQQARQRNSERRCNTSPPPHQHLRQRDRECSSFNRKQSPHHWPRSSEERPYQPHSRHRSRSRSPYSSREYSSRRRCQSPPLPPPHRKEEIVITSWTQGHCCFRTDREKNTYAQQSVS